MGSQAMADLPFVISCSKAGFVDQTSSKIYLTRQEVNIVFCLYELIRNVTCSLRSSSSTISSSICSIRIVLNQVSAKNFKTAFALSVPPNSKFAIKFIPPFDCPTSDIKVFNIPGNYSYGVFKSLSRAKIPYPWSVKVKVQQKKFIQLL